jgi:NADH dehydrogenase FAD-containing subunit
LSQLTQLPVLHLNQVKITLIEASERILPALSDKTAEHSAGQLKKMGVEILSLKSVKLSNTFGAFTPAAQTVISLLSWLPLLK